MPAALKVIVMMCKIRWSKKQKHDSECKPRWKKLLNHQESIIATSV